MLWRGTHTWRWYAHHHLHWLGRRRRMVWLLIMVMVIWVVIVMEVMMVLTRVVIVDIISTASSNHGGHHDIFYSPLDQYLENCCNIASLKVVSFIFQIHFWVFCNNALPNFQDTLAQNFLSNAVILSIF